MSLKYNKKSSLVGKDVNVKIRSRDGKLYVDYYVNGNRVRRSTGLTDTKVNRSKITKEIIPKIQAAILLGEYGKKRAKPLVEYIPRYLASKEKLISFDVKRKRCLLISEALGKVQVDRLTRSDIKGFLGQFDDRPYSKKEYLNDIRGILDVALDDEVITVNVARNIKAGKLGKPEIDPFSEEEVRKILANAHGMFKSYLAIAFNTGARSGEVLGLMHNDIGEQIHIRRTVTRGRVKEPKTLGSIRTIPMMDVLEPPLAERKKNSRALYLFDKAGGHLGDVGYFRRQWKTVLKNAGVRYRKIYNTRHTFITHMLNSGKFSVLQIAQIVGHSSPRMIMTTYAGFIKSEHLKIDVKTDLYGHNTGTVENTDAVSKSLRESENS